MFTDFMRNFKQKKYLFVGCAGGLLLIGIIFFLITSKNTPSIQSLLGYDTSTEIEKDPFDGKRIVEQPELTKVYNNTDSDGINQKHTISLGLGEGNNTITGTVQLDNVTLLVHNGEVVGGVIPFTRYDFVFTNNTQEQASIINTYMSDTVFFRDMHPLIEIELLATLPGPIQNSFVANLTRGGETRKIQIPYTIDSSDKRTIYLSYAGNLGQRSMGANLDNQAKPFRLSLELKF